jgi:Zn ribbon nucleic-acid-binding protein
VKIQLFPNSVFESATCVLCGEEFQLGRVVAAVCWPGGERDTDSFAKGEVCPECLKADNDALWNRVFLNIKHHWETGYAVVEWGNHLYREARPDKIDRPAFEEYERLLAQLASGSSRLEAGSAAGGQNSAPPASETGESDGG